MGLRGRIKEMTTDGKPCMSCNKMINRPILKAEMNAFIGRVLESFKTGNSRYTAEAGVCEGQGQGLLSLNLTQKEHISCPHGQHDRVTLIILHAISCCYCNTLLLTYQPRTIHLFYDSFGDHLKWVPLCLSQVSRNGFLCRALGEESTSSPFLYASISWLAASSSSFKAHLCYCDTLSSTGKHHALILLAGHLGYV